MTGPLGELIASYLAEVDGFVEATSYERHMLWKEDQERDIVWDEERVGYFDTIATVSDRPICLSFLAARIRDRRICFWEATSQLVDHKLIEEWFKRHFPGKPRVDAMNFPNVFRARAASVAKPPHPGDEK